MAKKSKILDALMKAFKAKDADEVEELAKKVEDEGLEDKEAGGDTHIHIHNGEVAEGNEPAARTEDDEPTDMSEFMARNDAEHEEFRSAIAALQEQLEALAGQTNDNETGDPDVTPEMIGDEVPEELKEEASKAKDSAYLQDSFQDTVALAEILVPGIRIPTFDRAMKPGKSFKQICGLRRQALDLAYHQPETRGILEDLLDGKPLDTKRMTCDATRSMFRSAAAMKRALNNNSSRQTAHDSSSNAKPSMPQTIGDLNKANGEYWKNH
jgi:hypothetical protein